MDDYASETTSPQDASTESAPPETNGAGGTGPVPRRHEANGEHVTAESGSVDSGPADDAGADEDDFEPIEESLGRDGTKLALHALLFASDRPLSAERLAGALNDADREMVAMLLGELKADVENAPLPYELREIAGGYQFVTKASYGPYIRRMLQVKKSNKLSKAALETLAILAYKQPVTRAEIEAIRGVSVAHSFDILLERRLIKVSGVAESPGRPKLYRTTEEFLVVFGLKSLKDLPSIEELREMN